MSQHKGAIQRGADCARQDVRDRNKMKRQIYFRGDPLCRAAVCIPFKTGVVDVCKAQSQQVETCKTPADAVDKDCFFKKYIF